MFNLFLNIQAESVANWIDPPDDLPYEKYVQLGAHNAMAAFSGPREEGGKWLYFQQNTTFYNLMKKYGIRAAEIDAYWYKQKTVLKGDPYRLALCHEATGNNSSCILSTTILRPGPPVKVREFFQGVKRYLDENPKAVITIFLESYLGSLKKTQKKLVKFKWKTTEDSIPMMDKAKKAWEEEMRAAGISDYIFTPENYKNEGGWPTLGKMRELNKRIVFISDEDEVCPFAFYREKYSDANHWSLEGHEEKCDRRGGTNPESQIFEMNHFYEFSPPTAVGFVKKKFDYSKVVNEYKFLDRRFNNCHKEHGKYPTIIMLDQADKGDGARLVAHYNEMNYKALKDDGEAPEEADDGNDQDENEKPGEETESENVVSESEAAQANKESDDSEEDAAAA